MFDTCETWKEYTQNGWIIVKSSNDILGIKCNDCWLTSWNPNDVYEWYCWNCGAYHERLGKGENITGKDLEYIRANASWDLLYLLDSVCFW